MKEKKGFYLSTAEKDSYKSLCVFMFMMEDDEQVNKEAGEEKK